MATGKRNKNKGQQARKRGNPSTQVNRPLENSSYHFQGWITCESKIEISKDQNIYSFSKQINGRTFPELQDYLTRYQLVTINSIGCRVITGMKAISGVHAVYAVEPQMLSLQSVPAQPNHMWLRSNGCKTKHTETNVVSPPSVPRSKVSVSATPATSATATGTVFGRFWWVFEGPSSASDRTHLGEVEVYIDAMFSGR